MEDVMILGGFALLCLGAIYYIYRVVSQSIANSKEADRRRLEAIEESKARAREARAKLRAEGDKARAYLASKSEPVKKRTFVKREEPAPSYAPSPTQSVQSSRSFLDDAADIAMIANTIHHWNDNTPHKSNTDSPIDFPKEERSVGVSKSESSWGFDDSDSRKSVSDTFGSSSSSYSSSSSDSSWSSSSSSDSFSSSASSDW